MTMWRLALAVLFLLAVSGPVRGVENPEPALRAYLDLDGMGAALDGDNAENLLEHTTWKESRGWDRVVVIRFYNTPEVWTEEKTARIKVVFEVVGRMDGMRFEPREEKETVMFSMVMKDGSWKVEGPELAPHVTVAGVMAFLKAHGGKSAEAKAALGELEPLSH